jgi:hypothetical protein
MEQFTNNDNRPEDSPEQVHPESGIATKQPEALEFVPKFTHLQEDLLYLFNIQITSEASLRYPWVKDEMYAKTIEELKLGTPFALDYFFEEKLLTKDELASRSFQELKPYAKTILEKYKGIRRTRAKDLFIDSGLLTEEETKDRL